jgi:hypothetical protein
MAATVMAVSTDAGDLLQASKLSFPAELINTTPVAISADTALLMELLLDAPRDISGGEEALTCRLTRYVFEPGTDLLLNLLATIGTLLLEFFTLATYSTPAMTLDDFPVPSLERTFTATIFASLATPYLFLKTVQ